MKRSQMKTLLLIEGAVCLTLTLALRLIEGAAFSFAAFPGSAAGQGLSMLASTGRLGFAFALTLYAFLALLPLYALAPPVAIQIMGVLYVHKSKAVAQNKADLLSDDGVIDLEDEEI